MSRDPLEVGARVADLLSTGRRVATYKLAVLSALVQHCLEHPTTADGSLSVSILELADRVVDLYWPQVRPFGGAGVLRQNEQDGRSLVDTVADLRRHAASAGLSTPSQLRAAQPVLLARARRSVAITLAQQPLFALQRSGGGAPGTPFLYDDSWLRKKLTVAELSSHGWAIELHSGIPHALARVSGLLQPVLQQWWVSDVLRLNAAEIDAPDLQGFLFGASRAAVARLAPGLSDLQAGRCFYCNARLGGDVHVDHVLPWSRVAIDGLANLVVADPRCNLAKSASLPALVHVRTALTRAPAALSEIAAPLRWPLDTERVVGAATSLYRSSPVGTPLWREPGVFDLLPAKGVSFVQ